MDDEQVLRGIAMLQREAARKIQEWTMTGCFVNEVFVDWEPPLVQRTPDLIILHERLRFL